MLQNALAIFSDLALILLGLLLARRFSGSFDKAFWQGAEKLVYYVLFPALLFNAINTAQFSLQTDLNLLLCAVGAMLGAIALSFLARPLLKPAPDLFASCVQTGFRYNSYIGLALAQTLLGPRGVALMALIVAFCVPIANVFAVYALARHRQTGLLRELATNPLIIATVGGLISNLLGLKLPVLVGAFLTRLSAAGLSLGLLCIGAGLTLAVVHAQRAVIGYFFVVKLLVFPALALALALATGLRGAELQLVLIFAALPTASTAYVLAARMGGTPAPVAFLITIQTLAAMVTLPLWQPVGAFFAAR